MEAFCVWILAFFVQRPQQHHAMIHRSDHIALLKYLYPISRNCETDGPHIKYSLIFFEIRRKEKWDGKSDWHHDLQAHIAKDRWLGHLERLSRCRIKTSCNQKYCTKCDINGHYWICFISCPKGIDRIYVWIWILALFHTTSTTTPCHDASTRPQCPSQINLHVFYYCLATSAWGANSYRE